MPNPSLHAFQGMLVLFRLEELGLEACQEYLKAEITIKVTLIQILEIYIIDDL